MLLKSQIIQIPPVGFFTSVAALVLLLVLFFALRRKRSRSMNHKTGEPNWSVPAIDDCAGLSSFFHDWDARIKIASLFVYCFFVVSLHRVSLSFLAFLIALLCVYVSHLPWSRPLRRLKAMTGFLSMFFITLPLTVSSHPGETLIVVGQYAQFPFHVSGFWLAVKIVLKACAVALMMEALFATAPFSVTLQALARIGIPQVVCQMVLLSHRYIFVFLHEMRRMYRGMRVRGFRRRTSIDTMQTIGNFLGMLFVRSFDRTQRVYDAMLSRGYRGTFPSYSRFQAGGADWCKGGLWIIIGAALLLADHTL